MPLITCPDCRQDVSDAAPACPHCGRPGAESPVPNAENQLLEQIARSSAVTAANQQHELANKAINAAFIWIPLGLFILWAIL